MNSFLKKYPRTNKREKKISHLHTLTKLSHPPVTIRMGAIDEFVPEVVTSEPGRAEGAQETALAPMAWAWKDSVCHVPSSAPI